MGMPGRRSNYSLLNQYREEEEPPQQQSKSSGGAGQSLSAEKNKVKFDWDGDYRFQQPGRISNMVPLQRQSSGSSFAESSLSGEYYAPAPAPANDPEVFGGGELISKGREPLGSSSSKTWAQQTEESYQLQLALALRLSADATCADDPNFLDPVPDESTRRSSLASPEALSHRFWVSRCLSYFDRIPDGFYVINGMDPYVWTICTDLQQNGRVPSLEALRVTYHGDHLSLEVVLIDKHSDSVLKELQIRAISLSKSCISPDEVVAQLAKLVCNHMGGAASTGEHGLVSRWKDCSEILKDCLDSAVLPIGSISVGLCRHRALLFKVLADIIDLPCRVANGCKYCRTNEASSCLLRFGHDS